MLLDRALRATVRNFSTLFLLVAAVTVPLHVAHAYVFRRVIAVSELHPAIEALPPTSKVSGVGLRQLRDFRITYLLLGVVEVALLPWLVRASGRVMDTDRRGGVPTLLGAWRGDGRPAIGLAGLRRVGAGPLLVAVALAVAVGWLTRAFGLLVVEPLPAQAAFAAVGLVEGACRAAGAPFGIGPIAWMASGVGSAGPQESEDT